MQLMGKVSDLMDMLGIDHNWMVRALDMVFAIQPLDKSLTLNSGFKSNWQFSIESKQQSGEDVNHHLNTLFDLQEDPIVYFKNLVMYQPNLVLQFLHSSYRRTYKTLPVVCVSEAKSFGRLSKRDCSLKNEVPVGYGHYKRRGIQSWAPWISTVQSIRFDWKCLRSFHWRYRPSQGTYEAFNSLSNSPNKRGKETGTRNSDSRRFQDLLTKWNLQQESLQSGTPGTPHSCFSELDPWLS